MSRFRAIAFVLLVAVMLSACGSAATPYPEEDYFATEAPAEVEEYLPDATDPPVSEPEPAAEADTDSISSSEITGEIFEMTNDNWGQLVDQSPLPVLMYFWAPSNDSSANLLSTLETIAYDYAGRIRVVTVNLDDYPDIGYYYSIFSDGPLPTVFLVINGNQEPWLEGVTLKDEITAMLDQTLDGSSSVSENESESLPPPSPNADIVEITSDNFSAEVLESSEPVLIHFWAEWMGASRAIKPELQEIANEYAGRLKVGEINVDEYPEFANQYGVEQLPTLVLVMYGSEYARLEGVVSRDEITVMLVEQLP